MEFTGTDMPCKQGRLNHQGDSQDGLHSVRHARQHGPEGWKLDQDGLQSVRHARHHGPEGGRRDQEEV